MSELKFRTWNWLERRYDKGSCAFLTTSGELMPSANRIIEQYTGLKDKNGKEIYEGDIVEYMTCYYGNEKRHRKVVEWGEWDSDDFGEPHNLGYFDLSEYMEVIGNIHENPELLEGEE